MLTSHDVNRLTGIGINMTHEARRQLIVNVLFDLYTCDIDNILKVLLYCNSGNKCTGEHGLRGFILG